MKILANVHAKIFSFCFRPVQVIVDPGISTEMFDSSIMNLMHNVATMYEIKVIRL